jgi:rhodanese-related sulfurtransferase
MHITTDQRNGIVICLSLLLAVLLVTSCAPAPTPTATPVPTAVPTVAAPPTALTQPTVAPTKAPTGAAATIPPTTVPPTKAAPAGPPTLPPTNATPTLIANTPKTADDIQVISPQLLKALIEGGADIAIVDVQPPEAFAIEHIKGAVNLPWDMKIKGTAGVPMSKLVVVYCACSPDEKASQTDEGDVAMQLITNFGYKKVALLEGGWVRWQQLGYPTQKGK